MNRQEVCQFSYLVVDDDPVASELLGSTLSHMGAERMFFAPDAAVALRLAQQHRPDFILLDLYMPEVDGWTALDQLRQVAPQAAVVVVTGSHQTADFMQSMDERVDGYCIKPVLPDLMEKALTNARARRSSVWL